MNIVAPNGSKVGYLCLVCSVPAVFSGTVSFELRGGCQPIVVKKLPEHLVQDIVILTNGITHHLFFCIFFKCKEAEAEDDDEDDTESDLNISCVSNADNSLLKV